MTACFFQVGGVFYKKALFPVRTGIFFLEILKRILTFGKTLQRGLKREEDPSTPAAAAERGMTPSTAAFDGNRACFKQSGNDIRGVDNGSGQSGNDSCRSGCS